MDGSRIRAPIHEQKVPVRFSGNPRSKRVFDVSTSSARIRTEVLAGLVTGQTIVIHKVCIDRPLRFDVYANITAATQREHVDPGIGMSRQRQCRQD